MISKARSTALPHRRHPRDRARAGVLASVMALSCALPTSAALAGTPPALGGVLSVADPSGQPIELLQKLTIPQLAALLNTSPAALIAQLESLSGQNDLSAQLSGLLADPTASVSDLLGQLGGAGLNTTDVEQLLETLLGPSIGTPTQLQEILGTILSDITSNGQLSTLAQELGTPVATLEGASLLPASAESLASTLGTTVASLGNALEGRTHTLTAKTATVAAPVSSSARGIKTELVAVPSPGGVSLTTISSTPATSASAAKVSNAFTIVSVKLTSKGSIVETVKLPHPGRLAVSAKGNANVPAKKAGHSKMRKALSVVPASKSFAAGSHTITLHPRKNVGSAKQLTASITTTYTPTGGTADTKHKSASFKPKMKKAARR